MARMTCKCGAKLNNQSAPNDIELVVLLEPKDFNHSELN